MLVFVLGFQLEVFLSLCYSNYVFFVKHLKFAKVLEQPHAVLNQSLNSFYFTFLFILSLFFKASNIQHTMYIFLSIFSLYLLDKVLSYFSLFTKLNTNFFLITTPLLVGFIYFFSTIKSFLLFFFMVELFGVIYYFSFLSSYSLTNQTLLKYKNGLLLLLWNNFLTTLFLALSCFLLLRRFGTTHFLELELLVGSSSILYLYLLGLGWKLGLPVFHFFKVEVYKYLLRENIFFFSIVTTIINVGLLYFILSITVMFTTLYLDNYLLIPILFSLVLILNNLKLYSILHYFALSSVFTMTTLLIVFLIN